MRRAKLKKLCEIEGFDDENELFAAAMSDSVCRAICCNPDNPECDYTAEMEPDQDQDKGWCEVCERGTLVSALVLRQSRPLSGLDCQGGRSSLLQYVTCAQSASPCRGVRNETGARLSDGEAPLTH